MHILEFNDNTCTYQRYKYFNVVAQDYVQFTTNA